MSGDLESLENIFSSKKLRESPSCSALIKIIGKNEDIFLAHDTWSGLNTMLRILKKYTLNYKTSNGDSKLTIDNNYRNYKQCVNCLN